MWVIDRVNESHSCQLNSFGPNEIVNCGSGNKLGCFSSYWCKKKSDGDLTAFSITLLFPDVFMRLCGRRNADFKIAQRTWISIRWERSWTDAETPLVPAFRSCTFFTERAKLVRLINTNSLTQCPHWLFNQSICTVEFAWEILLALVLSRKKVKKTLDWPKNLHKWKLIVFIYQRLYRLYF